jgi:hypothetical protein
MVVATVQDSRRIINMVLPEGIGPYACFLGFHFKFSHGTPLILRARLFQALYSSNAIISRAACVLFCGKTFSGVSRMQHVLCDNIVVLVLTDNDLE